MNIPQNDICKIRKIVRTLELTEAYKKRLQRYRDTVSGESGVRVGEAIRTDFLVHFTDATSAKNIIKDGLIRCNERKYIAFTELNFFEYGVLTINSKREFGFVFSKDELSANLPLFAPMSFNNLFEAKSLIIRLAKRIPIFRKYFVEKSLSGQASINYSVLSEIRTERNVSLGYCRLFFRNTDREDHKQSSYPFMSDLEKYAVFRLPYTSSWIKYFIDDQEWIYEENIGQLNIKDTASCPRADLSGVKKITTEKLIIKLKTYVNGFQHD